MRKYTVWKANLLPGGHVGAYALHDTYENHAEAYVVLCRLRAAGYASHISEAPLPLRIGAK